MNYLELATQKYMEDTTNYKVRVISDLMKDIDRAEAAIANAKSRMQLVNDAKKGCEVEKIMQGYNGNYGGNY